MTRKPAPGNQGVGSMAPGQHDDFVAALNGDEVAQLRTTVTILAIHMMAVLSLLRLKGGADAALCHSTERMVSAAVDLARKGQSDAR